MKALTITLLCLFLVNMAFAGPTQARSANCPTDDYAKANLVVDQGSIFLQTGKAPSACFVSLLQEWHKDQPNVPLNELVARQQDASMKLLSSDSPFER